MFVDLIIDVIIVGCGVFVLLLMHICYVFRGVVVCLCLLMLCDFTQAISLNKSYICSVCVMHMCVCVWSLCVCPCALLF